MKNKSPSAEFVFSGENGTVCVIKETEQSKIQQRVVSDDCTISSTTGIDNVGGILRITNGEKKHSNSEIVKTILYFVYNQFIYCASTGVCLIYSCVVHCL